MPGGVRRYDWSTLMLVPDDEPAVPAFTLKLSDEELERLRGKWVAADNAGRVKAECVNFDEVEAHWLITNFRGPVLSTKAIGHLE